MEVMSAQMKAFEAVDRLGEQEVAGPLGRPEFKERGRSISMPIRRS